MAIKRIKNKIVLITILAVMICLSFIMPIITTAQEINLAGSNEFDKTNVLSDLQGLSDFDINKYPYRENGTFELINFVEYCYAFRGNMQDNYALYAYIYNPNGTKFNTDSKANTIKMAVEFDSTGKPILYENLELQYCNKVEETNYKGLFYKFKVKNSARFIDLVKNKHERTYYISDVVLIEEGKLSAVAQKVASKYIFSGYVKGYGPDEEAESTLTARTEANDTITIDLTGQGVADVKADGIDKRTYWRSTSSSLGAGHQNQINSVFFAIDKSMLNKYGYKLQRINAEWYEYKTNHTVVISDKEVYDEILKDVGKKWDAKWDGKYGLFVPGINASSVAEGMYSFRWYADKMSSYDYLSNLYYTGGVAVSDYILTAEKKEEYIYNYNKSYHSGTIQTPSKEFSSDLFFDWVDSGRTRGYNNREFDIDNPNDYWDLKSYDSSHNKWDKFWDYGWGKIVTSDNYPDVPPIQMLTSSDMAQSDLASALFINKSDEDNLKQLWSNAQKNDQEVFIFRYAATDYYAAPLTVQKYVWPEKQIKDIAEVHSGTEFFDFNIISFTFNKNGVLSVIPVVSNPIDHISDYTPSVKPEEPDIYTWLKELLEKLKNNNNDFMSWLIKIVTIILCVAVAIPLFPYLIKLIVYIILLPYKIIKKATKPRNRKRRK